MPDQVSDQGPGPEILRDWQHFLQAETHILKDHPELLWQQAANQPLHSPIFRNLETLSEDQSQLPTPWIRWINRPRQPSPCLRTLTGHRDWVFGVAITPDGRQIISSGFDGDIRVSDAITGRELAVLRGRGIPLRSVVVTPDGKTIFSGDDGGFIRGWTTEYSTPGLKWKAHPYPIMALAAFPDSSRLVSVSDDAVKVWETGTGRCLAALQRPHGGVKCVAVAPGGDRLFSGSGRVEDPGHRGESHTITAWDPDSAKEVASWPDFDWISSMAFTPDGRWVVTGGGTSIRVWIADTGELLQRIEVPSDSIRVLALTPDCARAVSGGDDATVRVWEMAGGRELRCFRGHGSRVTGLLLTSDGRRILSSSADGTVKIWDVGQALPPEGDREAVLSPEKPPSRHGWTWPFHRRKEKALPQRNGQEIHPDQFWHDDGIVGIVMAPEAGTLVTADHRTLKVCFVDGREEDNPRFHRCWSTYDLRDEPPDRHIVRCVGVTRDGRLVVTGGMDHTLKVWVPRSGRCIRTLKGHRGEVTSLSVTSDGQGAVSAAEDGTVRVWMLAKSKCLRTLEGHEDLAVTSVAISPESQVVASGGWDRTIRVWDPANGRVIQVLRGVSAPVLALAFASRGELLLSGHEDGSLVVWEPGTGRKTAEFPGHRGPISGIAASPDGRHIVSASRDKTIRVWGFEGGRCVGLFFGSAVFSGVAWTNRRISAGDERGRVYLLDISALG